MISTRIEINSFWHGDSFRNSLNANEGENAKFNVKFNDFELGM